MIRKIFALIILTASSYVFGETELPSNLVAEWFRYDGQLVEQDVTGKAKKQIGEDLIWSKKYYSEDNTFAPVQIGLAKAGSILNQNFLKMLQDRNIEYLEIEGKPTGIAFSSGFGPGGSSFTTILSSRANDLDLILKLTIPGDPPLDRTVNSEYLEIIFEASILDRLQSIGTEVIGHVEATLNEKDSKAVSEIVTNPPEVVKIAESIEGVNKPDPTIDEEAAVVVVAEPIEEDVEQSSNWWLWLIGGLVVVIGLGLAVRRKS